MDTFEQDLRDAKPIATPADLQGSIMHVVDEVRRREKCTVWSVYFVTAIVLLPFLLVLNAVFIFRPSLLVEIFAYGVVVYAVVVAVLILAMCACVATIGIIAFRTRRANYLLARPISEQVELSTNNELV